MQDRDLHRSRDSFLQPILEAVQRAADEEGLRPSQRRVYRTWITGFLQWCRSHPPYQISLNRISPFLEAVRQRVGPERKYLADAMDALSFLFGSAWKRLNGEALNPNIQSNNIQSDQRQPSPTLPGFPDPSSGKETSSQEVSCFPISPSLDESESAKQDESPTFQRAKAAYEIRKSLTENECASPSRECSSQEPPPPLQGENQDEPPGEPGRLFPSS